MSKHKLAAPEGCHPEITEIIEIWIGDEKDCFSEDEVSLPKSPQEYQKYVKSDGSTIFIPEYIEIDLPAGITPAKQRFYYFAKGNFNAAFRNFPVKEGEDANDIADGLLFAPVVLKLPLDGTADALAQLDAAERAARVFNECNEKVIEDYTTVAASASVTEGKNFFGKARVIGNGWLAPYIVGSQANSEKICSRLIQLFNETQRIVVDSYVENNLLTDGNNNTWIIDSGFAMQLGFGDPAETHAEAEDAELSPKSKASFCVWNSKETKYSEHYGRHFLDMLFPVDNAQTLSKPAAVLPEMLLSMALLYIQKEHPEIRDVSCLQKNPELIDYFAAAYIEQAYKKHFEKSSEKINALSIEKEGQKLTGITEKSDRLDELKQKYISSIETIGDNENVESAGGPNFLDHLQVSLLYSAASAPVIRDDQKQNTPQTPNDKINNILAQIYVKNLEYEERAKKQEDVAIKKQEADGVKVFVESLAKHIKDPNQHNSLMSFDKSLPAIPVSGGYGSKMRYIHNQIKGLIDTLQKPTIVGTKKAMQDAEPALKKAESSVKRNGFYAKDDKQSILQYLHAALQFREVNYQSRKLKGEEHGFWGSLVKKPGTSASEKLLATKDMLKAITNTDGFFSIDVEALKAVSKLPAAREGGLGDVCQSLCKLVVPPVPRFLSNHAKSLKGEVKRSDEIIGPVLVALDERVKLSRESNDPVEKTKIEFCRDVASKLLQRSYEKCNLPALLFIADTMLNDQLTHDQKLTELRLKQQSLYQERAARRGARCAEIYGDANTVLLPIINHRWNELVSLASDPEYRPTTAADKKM